MKVRIEIEGRPDDFQELFVPSEKQHEFLTMTYNAYVEALKKFVWDNVDPYNYVRDRDERKG